MKKTLLISTVIVLGILSLMFWGRSRQTITTHSNTRPSYSLVASEQVFNFGTISMKDGLVNHTFTITNSSDKDVFIEKVYTSCMCTTAYLESPSGEKGPFGMEGMGYLPPANEALTAGESRDIKVVYDPNAHGPAGVGSIDRVIYLIDSSGKELQLEIQAIVTP